MTVSFYSIFKLKVVKIISAKQWNRCRFIILVLVKVVLIHKYLHFKNVIIIHLKVKASKSLKRHHDQNL